MVKRTLLYSLCLLFISIISSNAFVCNAQTGYKEKENPNYLSEEEIRSKLNELRQLRTTLPEKVDHSQSKYMSEVISQGAMGSCGSASRICYMFAYEINNYRDLSGKDAANKYPSHFTWLLTGQNSDKENMAIFNGIPKALVYGTINTGGSIYQYNPVYGGYTSWPDKYPRYGWMTGYDKWRSAMDNRLEKTAEVKMNSDAALEYVKWWIYNHHGDDSFNEGGVVGGGAATGGWVSKKNADGKWYISSYGPAIDHGITFAGYDDTVWCDLNGDGIEDEDEIGALILLNSWGATASSHNKGCVLVPYKIVKSYGGGLGAELYYIRKDYEPIDVFRIKMDYNQRCNMKISIGVSSDPEASAPEKMVVAEHFNYAGFEKIPLLGEYNKVINEDPMEFGLDLTDLTAIGFDTRDAFRYFLVIETKSGSTGTGEVQELEVIRHTPGTQGSEKETVGKITSPVSISGSGKKIIIPIDVPGNDAVEPKYIYVPQKELSVYSVSSQEASGEGSNNGLAKYSLDGNESTYWHSAWTNGGSALPHQIVFKVPEEYEINGFEYLPRQNNSNGRIGDYEFYVSDSGKGPWTLVSSGTFENNKNAKRAFFDAVSAQYVKLINKKTANGDPNTCMAEFNLFYSSKTEDATSISEIEQEEIKISQTDSNLEISGVNGTVSLVIYDMQGQTVALKNSELNPGSVAKLDISNLSKGVYILKVTSPNQVLTKKFLIK